MTWVKSLDSRGEVWKCYEMGMLVELKFRWGTNLLTNANASFLEKRNIFGELRLPGVLRLQKEDDEKVDDIHNEVNNYSIHQIFSTMISPWHVTISIIFSTKPADIANAEITQASLEETSRKCTIIISLRAANHFTVFAMHTVLAKEEQWAISANAANCIDCCWDFRRSIWNSKIFHK